MNNLVWRVVVYRVNSEVGEDGVTTTTKPVASFCTSALTGQDAVMQWGDQLAQEESS